MTENNRCLSCGAAIPRHAPAGQCPKCMLRAGFDSDIPGQDDFQPPAVEVLNSQFSHL